MVKANEEEKVINAKRTASPVAKKKEKTTKAGSRWNAMAHLKLKRFMKRFTNDDNPKLTPGARRNRKEHPHVALVELDPSGRALCKRCGGKLVKGQIRHVLMLECHKGYRNACTLHPECFWKHPETKKLEPTDEIFFSSQVEEDYVDGFKERLGNQGGR